ncbi:MAG: murein hydrolase activator EnvC family protein [Gaiellaceae bacterium]
MHEARRIRLLAAVIGAALVLGVPSALAQSLSDEQAEVDRSISGLREDIEAAKAKEGVLSTDIEAASTRISALTGDIDGLAEQIAVLEQELAEHRARLAELEDLFERQTADLEHLKRQYAAAQRILEERLVELYQQGEEDSLGVLLQVQSLTDLLEQVEYFDNIGRQDRAISDSLKRLKGEMRVAREKTAATKAKVADATAVIADKTAEQIAAREALVAEQQALDAARASKQSLLASTRENRHEAEEDLEAMQAASAPLAARIRAAQAAAAAAAQSAPSSGSSGSGVSASGFIWPVSGVVTSGFGWRWGRMHEGIDISASGGTQIRAAAGGTIIFSGWMGGYGQLTVIDHGNGLATAYAHQSAVYVGGGSVSQGTVIGAVGCTGSCTGNHLHFEVRVNGSAVDPMGYL